MRTLIPAIDFLNRLERRDLACLLEPAIVRITKAQDDVFGVERTTVVLRVPEPFAEALERLSPTDKTRIAEALCATDPMLSSERPDHISLRIGSTGETLTDPDATLLPELIAHRGMLIDVATGGSPINEVNDYYKARHKRLKEALKARGTGAPVEYADLWEWYQDYKNRFPSYQERREYITACFETLIASLVAPILAYTKSREPTGWTRVDRALAKARQRLEVAMHEEDFQTVGLLCRELLISVAQAVYDPERHPSSDGVAPSTTDVQRMLDAFFGVVAAGRSNEAIRKYAKTALTLALDLQHRRTATLRHAALCLEACASTVNVIAILSGQHDRPAS